VRTKGSLSAMTAKLMVFKLVTAAAKTLRLSLRCADGLSVLPKPSSCLFPILNKASNACCGLMKWRMQIALNEDKNASVLRH
jgi:hypothetical protein